MKKTKICFIIVLTFFVWTTIAFWGYEEIGNKKFYRSDNFPIFGSGYIESWDYENNVKWNFEEYKDILALYNIKEEKCKYVSYLERSEDGQNIYFDCWYDSGKMYPDLEVFENGKFVMQFPSWPSIANISLDENGNLVVEAIKSYFTDQWNRITYTRTPETKEELVAESLSIKEVLSKWKYGRYLDLFDAFVEGLSDEKLNEILGKIENMWIESKAMIGYRNVFALIGNKIKLEKIERELDAEEVKVKTEDGDSIKEEND